MRLVTFAASITLSSVLLAGLALLVADPAHPSNPRTPPRPVLLELFTSEGCSSCPPADRLLESFDRTQPVAGADLIVLSEHVDYWNRLGWVDPFSSAQFTQRQQDYVSRLHLDTAYTPQLVIDGRREVIGSDERAARAAILKSEADAKAAIALGAQRSGGNVKIQLKVAEAARGAVVFVALANDHTQSHVTRGENSGHTLAHVAVVRTMVQTGKADAQGSFAKDLTLPLQDGAGPWRVVVFVEDAGSKQILGAAQARL